MTEFEPKVGHDDKLLEWSVGLVVGRYPADRSARRAARRRGHTAPTVGHVIWLFVAFVVVPVLEIFLITQVAGALGWIPALALVIGVSVVGAWLVRREGIGVIGRVRNTLGAGGMPTTELADGAMIFFGSALMLTPGFLTDALGLALLIPPTRALLRPPVIAFFRRRIDVRIAGLGGGDQWPFGATGSEESRGGRPTRDGDIVDIGEDSIRNADDPPQ